MQKAVTAVSPASSSLPSVSPQQILEAVKNTPLLLYVFKKGRSSTLTEPSLVLLYADENNSSTSLSDHPTWTVTASRIPVSLEDDVEQVALAIGYVSAGSCSSRGPQSSLTGRRLGGVTFLEELSCVLSVEQLAVNERAQLRNKPGADDGNRMSVSVERKGANFVEVLQIAVTLNEKTLRLVAGEPSM